MVHPLVENADCTDYIQKTIDGVSARPKKKVVLEELRF